MALRSLTPEEIEKARTSRQQSILAKWIRAVRLSKSELDEIRHIIGDEQYNAALATPGTGDPLAAQAGYVEELSHYSQIFKRSVRQIKRWVSAGRHAKPAELPPLDQPGKMLAWWNRMLAAGQLKQKPPAILEHFAIEQAKAGPDKIDGAQPGISAIDVGSLDVKEGEALKQARGFLAATAQQLSEAYKGANDALIGRVQTRWEKSLAAVRLAEASERKAAEARGDLLPKHEVISELSRLIEMLRNMQNTMSRRVRARLGVLPAEIDGKLDAAIMAEREREIGVLQRAKYFRSVDEVILELNQAAGVAA